MAEKTNGKLTAAQRAALGLAILEEEKELALERQREGRRRIALVKRGELPKAPHRTGGHHDGQAAQRAAVRAGVGRNSLIVAEVVKRQSPATFEKMKRGEITVADAAREAGFDTYFKPSDRRVVATAADNINAAHFYSGLAAGVIPAFDRIPDRQTPGLLRKAEEALAWWSEMIVTLKEGIER